MTGRKKWLIAIAVVIVLLLLLVLGLLAMIADVPCQDGYWDESRHSCVPDGLDTPG